MANRNRAKGDRFEYKVRDHLRDYGWFVMRSPASKSPIDLLCVRSGHDGPEVMFVQCKTNGRLDPGEWDILVDLAWEHSADPVLAQRPKRGVIQYELLTGYKVPRARVQPRPEIDPT